MACVEELSENVVLVGRAYESADRKSHPEGIPARHDVSEVACRNNEVDLVSLSDDAALYELAVCREVVNDLRNEPSYINGVGARKRYACSRLRDLPEELLYSGLSVVEVSADSACRYIGAVRCHHLEPLCIGYSAVRVEDDDACARNITESLNSRASGVSRSCGQDHDVVSEAVHAACRAHEIRKGRESNVLESRSWAVPELEHPCVACLYQRSDVCSCKLVLVARLDQFVYLLFAVIVKEDVPDVLCHSSEILFDDAAPVGLYSIDVGRNIKSAALSLSVKDGLARTHSYVCISCACVFDHNCLSLFLKIFQTVEKTPCLCYIISV